MRSEQTRSSLSRPIATTLILLASGLACSAAAGEPISTQLSHLENVQIQGRTVHSVQIENAEAASSIGTVTGVTGQELPYFFTNNVIVQSNDWDSVLAVINSRAGLELGRELGNNGRFRVIHATSVRAAFELQRILTEVDGVISCEVDSGRTYQTGYTNNITNIDTDLRDSVLRSRLAAARPNSKNASGYTKLGVGVKPYDQDSNPASIPTSQWHFTNTVIADHDNNIPESIFSTDLLTGAGVTFGYASFSNRQHLDVDHTELVNAGGRPGGYKLGLSQVFDPILDDDDTFMTGDAGIMIAERNSPVTANDVQGVAPDASLITKFRGPTPLFESQAYEWQLGTIDVRVNQLFNEYDAPGANYNANYVNEFVSDSYRNSLKFGRGRKGTINIFGTGSGFNFAAGLPTNLLANPYDFTSEPFDVFATNSNQVGVSLTNGFVDGPFFVGGQTAQFPLANEHNSLIIATVSEDGEIDSFGAIGPGVFASVYAGSANAFWSGSQAISGRGVSTIVAGTQPPGSVAGEGPLGLLPDPADGAVLGNTTGSAVAAGIVGLMLEANPRLKVRDIRHIFFESIQESMRADSAKWPKFDSTRAYYSPGAGAGGNSTLWQTNTAFYNNANPPVTVPPTDPVVNQAIRHSDQYGFGVIDANLAIQKAKTWSGVKPLIVLDSGIVGDVNDNVDRPDADDPRLPIEIEDATFTEPDPEPDGNVPVVTGAASLVPGANAADFFTFCVRQNIKIESIIVELTIEGEGSNDLYIELQSPTGVRSILLFPTTQNLIGTSSDLVGNDDESDLVFDSGIYNGTSYAYYQHPFMTNKHWGDLSGGTWSVRFADFGPDTTNPEGADPGDDLAMEPGADTIVDLGELGVPGSDYRSQKIVTAFRVKIYGTDTGAPVFLGCDPFATSCPADLNGDGIIDIADLQLFIFWYQTADARADLSGDGQIDFADIQSYFSIFDPGYCVNSSSPPFAGGRPIPAPSNSSDTNPQTRPF